MPRVDLPIRLPEGVQGKHCAQHLLEFLDTHPGVSMAEIDQNQSTLRLQFDSDRLHLTEVEAIARYVGADLGKQFHHCLMYLGKPRCRDGTESLEREISKLQGVSHVSANPAASSIVVEYGDGDLTPAQIEHRVHRLGYEARRDFLQLLWEDWSDGAWTVACGFFLIAGVAAEKLGASDAGRVLMFMLSYVAGGHIAALEAVRSLRSGRFDVNFLMIAAAVGAAIINQWMEGAILLFLFSLSNTLKSYALGKTRKAIHSLIALKPQHALLKIGNVERRVPIETLKIGDLVLVKPGERIAADGIVIGGYSAVDQSAITGESMPVEKNIGHQVFAGTLNGGGSLTVEVIKLASDTTLAKIIKLIEEAQCEKAPTQRLIDRAGTWYTPSVIAATFLMATVPALLFNQPFEEFFYRAMVLLVVASPCALVISTPATILSAIANGGRNGIIFKGGLHLENAAMVKVVAFDKTGTLTEGQPVVTEVAPSPKVKSETLLSIAASIERLSQHPIAHAIVQEANLRELPIQEAADLQIVPGRGVTARIGDEKHFVGNERFLQTNGFKIPAKISEKMARLESEGKTTILVGNRTLLGMIGIADVPRKHAFNIAKELKNSAGVEKVVMLSGDRRPVAEHMAQELHMDEVYAELLPEEKVRVVKQLLLQHEVVAMVGDGVNDAPALASATIGFAMGAAGTDVALETADVILMSDDLRKLPQAIQLGRRARRVIKQNLVFAIAMMSLLVLSAVFGILTLPLGVIGHEGSTVLVLMNGLRLLSNRWS